MAEAQKEQAVARRSRSASEKFDQRAAGVAAKAAGKKKKATRKDTKTGRFYNIDGEDYGSVTTVLGVIAKPALIRWAVNQEQAFLRGVAWHIYADSYASGLPPMTEQAFNRTWEKRKSSKQEHERQVQRASDIGSKVHHAVEAYLREKMGQVVEPVHLVTDEAKNAFTSALSFFEQVEVKPIYIEQTVFNHKEGYAGTMDLWCEMDGSQLLKALRDEDRDLATIGELEGRRVNVLVDFKTGKSIYSEAFLQNAAYQEALSVMGHGETDVGLVVRLPKHAPDPEFEVGLVPPRDQLMPVFLSALKLWRWWYVEDRKSYERWKKNNRKGKE